MALLRDDACDAATYYAHSQQTYSDGFFHGISYLLAAAFSIERYTLTGAIRIGGTPPILFPDSILKQLS
jgi:hypothetical protein